MSSMSGNRMPVKKSQRSRNLVLRRQTDNRQFSAPAHGSQCGLQCRRIPRCFPQNEIPLNVPFIADNEIDIYGIFRYANTYPKGIEGYTITFKHSFLY
jgi:hypothetical protein